MKQITFMLLLLNWVFHPVQAQKELNYISFSITNHHPKKPFGSFSKLFYRDFHPGVEVSTGFEWKTSNRHQWVQDFQIGYFYHQWIQHAINLHTNLGYGYRFNNSSIAGIHIGAGYVHAIPDTRIFEISDDGRFDQKRNWGRPQALAVFSISFSQRLGTQYGLTAAYEQKIQFPFINEYVPLLPYTALKIGIRRNLYLKNKKP